MRTPIDRLERRDFFREKNRRRRLVTDLEERRANRAMGRLLSLGLFKKDSGAGGRGTSNNRSRA